MFARLKRMVRRMFAERSGPARRLTFYAPDRLDLSDPPLDPFARVREPRRGGGPGGRSSAVALLEPPDHFDVAAIGSSRRPAGPTTAIRPKRH